VALPSKLAFRAADVAVDLLVRHAIPEEASLRARMAAVLSALALTIAVVASAVPAAAASATDYVATINVGSGSNVEYFRVHLVQSTDITAALANMNKQSDRHPNGRIVRTGPELNVGYSWHIDPNDVAFVDVSVAACDGLPSTVERRALPGGRYCPWSARVVQMTPLV
jgi:hypothetical protein